METIDIFKESCHSGLDLEFVRKLEEVRRIYSHSAPVDFRLGW